MPTDKRARQRAGRQARIEAMARQKQRRRRVRSSVIVVLIAAVVVGSVYLITKKSPTTKAATTAQGRLEATWSKAGCPTRITTATTLKQYKKPAQTLSPIVAYNATVKTDVGSFVIKLDSKDAPIAVNSFVYLAEHKFYNCNLFHRVIQGFVDQTGDPTGTGKGGPGYTFTEAGPATATPQYPLGSVALANSNNPATTTPTTNGSQWFIVAGSQGESLPPDYVLFGQVTSGMSVVDKINHDGAGAGGSETGTPKLYHRILSVTIKGVPDT